MIQINGPYAIQSRDTYLEIGIPRLYCTRPNDASSEVLSTGMDIGANSQTVILTVTMRASAVNSSTENRGNVVGKCIDSIKDSKCDHAMSCSVCNLIL